MPNLEGDLGDDFLAVKFGVKVANFDHVSRIRIWLRRLCAASSLRGAQRRSNPEAPREASGLLRCARNDGSE
jgi:hypothetical protein